MDRIDDEIVRPYAVANADFDRERKMIASPSSWPAEPADFT